MAKELTLYRCLNCNTEYPKWLGKCEACDSWNSLSEEVIVKAAVRVGFRKTKTTPIAITDIQVEEREAIDPEVGELRQVLGQGFVVGSVTLFGGEPGVGKSTLALQLAQTIAQKGDVVLYVSGEESLGQVQMRSRRIGKNGDQLLVLSETNILDILEAIEAFSPKVVILDSIQVVHHPDIPSLPGSVNQVRHCANQIISVVKDRGLVGILIGHITKEGSLAGPKVLEHMVDVILYLEGERNQKYRILRSYKNRFGTTDEIGVFAMQERGLVEVSQPSELFIEQSTLSSPGSIVSAVMEGSRVLLVEVQALVVKSGYGIAKRNFLGVNQNRANLMIATIEKILGLNLSQHDIFLNIIGGLKVSEPALDLSIVVAIISSFHEKAMNEKVAVMGEVGLTGETRAVPHFEKRLAELRKMGFTGCYLPEKNQKPSKKGNDITPYYVKNILDVARLFLTGSEAGR
ncbi:MAG: DNA repair protein RadA/Sms [Candidatus Marinamargulisbacteria bacterium]|jgi:DNA repair protein RadA/Sms